MQAAIDPYRYPDLVAGVVPDLRAIAAGRDVVLMIGRLTAGRAPLLSLVARFALYDWTQASPERELHWLSLSTRTAAMRRHAGTHRAHSTAGAQVGRCGRLPDALAR
ncbi:MAG TPA: hypothetical protein VML75_00285 [Kofleriaceae bacterium]|nr:hypothetical protein [Kofleriaceae bacterium]